MLGRGIGPLLCCFLARLAWAADWPQWRGPNRDGISAETGLLDAWPKGGPPLVWKIEGLGEGYSSAAIAGGRLFIQGQHADEECVLAFDANTGKQLWRAHTGIPFRESKGDGPRGTPTVDGDRVYALAADGMLVCLETATGKRIWGFNIVDHFHGRVPQSGGFHGRRGHGSGPGERQAAVAVRAGGQWHGQHRHADCAWQRDLPF